MAISGGYMSFYLSQRFKILLMAFMGVLSLHSQDIRLGLKNYPFKSASVLPIMYKIVEGKPVKYAILAQEANPRKRGEYDDFGGRRDENDFHPLQTASREFFEEAIVPATLGWSLRETMKHIDLKSGHTLFILAVAKRVMYITHFSASDIATLKDNFHKALHAQTSPIFQEKMNIATVRWDALESAIKHAKSRRSVTVDAIEVDPQTGIDQSHMTKIHLRPLLVKRLKPYFLNQPYQEGKKKRIRFYE